VELKPLWEQILTISADNSMLPYAAKSTSNQEVAEAEAAEVEAVEVVEEEAL
jgi:hypothetical protein